MRSWRSIRPLDVVVPMDAGRNRWVATARTSSRNIYNQSLSLQSKSSILLFATTCPTFPHKLAARASDGFRLCPVAGATDVACRAKRKSERAGSNDDTNNRFDRLAVVPFVPVANASGANVALWLRLVPEARPGVMKPANFRPSRGEGALRLRYARPNIYKTWRRFGLATKAAPGHDEGKISRYPGKLEK
jgi:hypothetical protein